jgi:AcrR family transcriptional regulator
MERVSGAALRQKILDEAIGLVYGEGVDHITMRALGERLGYSPATIYLYFRNKGELLTEIARHGFEKMAERSLPLMADPDARAALRGSIVAYIDFALENPALYKLMFEALPPARQNESRFPKARELYDRRIEVFRRGAEQGVFRDVDSDIQFAVYWSIMHGFAMLSSTDRMPPPDSTRSVRQLRELVADEVITALAPD